MTRRSSALALALLLFRVPVSAQAPAEPLQVPYRLVTLDNGLTVILHQDRSVPVVAVYSLPEDYFERYVATVRAVTPAAVQKAGATYVQPSRFAVVVVGDRKTIEAPIRALNLASTRVMSVAEALGQ